MNKQTTQINRRLACSLAGALMLLAANAFADDDHDQPKIIPPHSAPAMLYGKTYGEWSAEHWKWVYSLPADHHPLTDTADISAGQSGNVWFLGGSCRPNPNGDGTKDSRKVKREATMPFGKALFFPIIDAEASVIEGNGATEAALRDAAEGYIHGHVEDLDCEIDGRDVKDLERFQVESSQFTFGPLPSNNLLGDPALAGKSSAAVSDGYFVMVAPLSQGEHTIQFKGKLVFTKDKDGFDFTFSLDITYRLTVLAAKLVHKYTLPPFSLSNFGYTQSQLDAAKANGLTNTDLPAIGSGLQKLNGNHYLSVTDRGPNADRADGNKAFPLPQYTPTIVLFKTDDDKIIPEDVLPIINDLGQGVTGIPNGPADDSTPYLTLLTPTNSPLAFNPDGMDIEDVHTLPGGGFILVEEYAPSVVIVSPTGNVLKRYTPSGKTLPGAHYTVSDSLPAVLKQRRANRGFEALALSNDGKTAYTMLQSPMGSTAVGSAYRDSRLIRILRLDISNPLNIQVTGQFVFKMLPVSEFPPGSSQRDLKVSCAAWVGPDKLLIGEGGDLAPVKLVLVNLAGATDVKNLASASAVPLVLEDVAANLTTLGITPAETTVVADLGNDLPEILDRKLEGLTILNANEVSISNDNDFGIGAIPGASSVVYQIRLPKPLR
jgi:alkaline phosphatase